jgi:hypothetical protein
MIYLTCRSAQLAGALFVVPLLPFAEGDSGWTLAA